MALGKLDRADARIKRRIARGVTTESLRASRASRKAARDIRKNNFSFQKRVDAYHAAWVAAGMASDFPTMNEWESRS